MASVLRFFLIIAILFYFIFIIYFLRKKALHLKYCILWLVSGIVMLLFVLFPQLLEILSHMLGIVSPVNMLFACELFFLMLILMSITSIVSKQNEKSKRTIQQLALLEKRIRELEEEKEGKS